MKTLYFLLPILLLTACIGDKQTAIGQDLSDHSFVNKNFKGNAINYSEGLNPCELFGQADIAKLYDVPGDKVFMTGPSTVGQICSYRIMMGDNEYNLLTGFMSVEPTVKKEDDQGGIAEATGSGENWVEAWALQKSISRSSEFLPDMGMAAIWNDSKRMLRVKFEGYILNVTAPGAPFNEVEKTKNRDYKAIAIEMARSAGFIN
jgi:hypothetical protein